MNLKRLKGVLAKALIIFCVFQNINVLATTNEVEVVVENKVNEENIINNIETIDTKDENNEEVSSKEQLDNVILAEEINSNQDVNNEDINNKKVNSKEELNANEEVKPTEEINSLEESDKNLETNSTNSLKGKTYTKTKIINTYSINSVSIISNEVDREEFKLKQEAVSNLEVLVPMTDSEYELTIANEDGSFEYLDSYDDIDSAVNAARSISESSLEASQQPAIINSHGQVVYSTNQMARVLRYQNNQYSPGNVYIYSDSSLTDAITYVNQSYMDDAPILEVKGNAVKVMINGVEGWMNANTSSGTYDIRVIPLNQAKNPSYYTVKNGELVHFISYDLEGSTGYEKILGKAPTMLSEGVRYLSYDGQYFYKYNHKSQSSISSALNTLIKDYASGVRSNSINSNNKFYLYYLYLPFRSQTIYSASDLNKYLNNSSKVGRNSKLYNLGQAFKDAENKYGVNALLALSIAINESAYGNSQIAQSKNNLFGLKAYDSAPGESASSFATPTDSVVDFAKNYISRGYADPADWRYYGGFLGNKYRGTNVKYASDPFWGEKAASFAYEIDKYLSGGNSNLKDTNSKQIGITTSNNKVINKSGTLLYNVVSDTNQYGAYINTPFVISDLQKITINGKAYYEINPERTTAIGSGGSANKYHGNYSWSDKGYILAENISFINVYIPSTQKLYGNNRYETSVKLSNSEFSSAETIVISNGYAIPDGLTATPIASYYNSPLLLVDKNSIPISTQNEIKRLKAKNVIIVGGTGVVSSNVEQQLKSLGVTKITRLGGANRYETALQVAKYIDSNLYDVQNVIIAGGLGEADALSVASVAGRDKMPIILVEKNNITTSVYNWLKSESLNNAYIIGGTGVVSNTVLNNINSITKQNVLGNRLGGANRYETNAKIIEKFYGEVVESVYVTVGLTLADALSAGPVAAVNSSPIVLSEDALTSTQKSVLNKMTTNKIVQVGGQVSTAVINNLKELLSGTK